MVVHVCKLAMKELDERVGSASCMRERGRGRKVTIICSVVLCVMMELSSVDVQCNTSFLGAIHELVRVMCGYAWS